MKRDAATTPWAVGTGALRRAPAADPAAASRRLAAAVREHGTLLGAGLAIWHDAAAGSAAADALAADLTLLQVPHRILRAFRPPRRPGRLPRPGAEVRISQGSALERLQHQAPIALRQAARSTPVDSEFDVAAWAHGRDGVAVPAGAVSGLAADWPCWQSWQAAEMGLACAACRTDLRPRAGDDARRAIREPGSGLWPIRLLCEACHPVRRLSRTPDGTDVQYLESRERLGESQERPGSPANPTTWAARTGPADDRRTA
ncbi:hypothetical protein ACFVUN_34650 [Kitasatospora griseola]|uniref:hypothetical protein n=1 Tax=Kitasatospora griseola TaxID=2064 RepID=UPI0036DA744C